MSHKATATHAHIEQQAEAFVDAVLDDVIPDEIGALHLTVGNIVAIARWLAPVHLAAMQEALNPVSALLAHVHVVPVVTLDGHENAPVIWPHELRAALTEAGVTA